MYDVKSKTFAKYFLNMFWFCM